MENSMQEVQTSKSEKMVPIDTSGESVDIELKEDKVDSVNESSTETPVVEVQEDTTETPVVVLLPSLCLYITRLSKAASSLRLTLKRASPSPMV